MRNDRRPSEIDGILEKCKYDKVFGARVLAMGGRPFTVCFCCNAGHVRRVKVEQEGHDEILKKENTVPILRQIEDVVLDRDFVDLLREFTSDKIDIEVTCLGYRVSLPMIMQVS